MKEEQHRDGVHQSLEITNAKGETSALLETPNKYKQTENPECNHDLFYKELRVIAEDSAREDLVKGEEENGSNWT